MPNLVDWLLVFGNSSEIEKVMIYNPVLEKFIILVPEGPSNESYTLKGGEGLIIYAKNDKSLTFAGLSCTSIDLKQGFNLVGLSCRPNDYSAFQLLNALGSENISSIQRYSAEKGAFESAGFNQSGQTIGIDIPIAPGEGYFIYMKQEMLDYSLF